MDLSVIIPIYREASTIAELVVRLHKVCTEMNLKQTEFIFVIDGAKDNSLEVVKALSLNDSTIKYINLSRNFGHQIAVSAGLEKTSGDKVVIIDGDLQDPPELIIELYAKLALGYEVVYAKRRSRQGEGVMKKFTAALFYRILAKMTSIDIPIDTGDFRIMDKKIVDVLNRMPEQQKFLRGQISWIGFNQTYVEYDRYERAGGKSGYTYRKLIRLALDGITSFSNFPLKFASITGFIVSGISFVMILYALYSRLISKDYVAGWTSIMLAVLFLGGIQLVGIGIIGEYISRMSDNIRKRPLYVVKETNIEN
jgi:polyisoprenyl-phosphate glycosyltransferase